MSVYVILCRLCLITGGGAAIPGYGVGVVRGPFVRVNLSLCGVCGVSRHLVCPISAAPATMRSSLMVFKLLFYLCRRSTGRGVDRRALGDYDSLNFPSVVFQVNL